MQMELPFDGSRLRELDALVMDRDWVDEQVNRLAGWEILTRIAKGLEIEPMNHCELCDRIGYPRVNLTIRKIKSRVNE